MLMRQRASFLPQRASRCVTIFVTKSAEDECFGEEGLIDDEDGNEYVNVAELHQKKITKDIIQVSELQDWALGLAVAAVRIDRWVQGWRHGGRGQLPPPPPLPQ